MAWFGWFGPKWQSKDPAVRLAAVETPGALGPVTLSGLAAEDPDERVRLAAVAQLDDCTALEALAARKLTPAVDQAVRLRVQGLLCAQLLAGTPGEDSEALLTRIEDPVLLERVAVGAATPALRVAAVRRIDDPQRLCAVVEQPCGKEAGRAAVEKLTDSVLLERIAHSAASKVTRRLAEEKLAAAAADGVAAAEPPTLTPIPDPRHAALAELVTKAQALAAALSQGDAGTSGFADLESAWLELDPEQADPRRAAFLSARERFDQVLESQRQQLLTRLEALSKNPRAADAELQVQEAQQQWQAWDTAAPAPAHLSRRYAAACGDVTAARTALATEQRRWAEWEKQLGVAETQLDAGDLEEAEPALAALAGQLQASPPRHLDRAPLHTRLQTARARCTELQAAARVAAQQSAAAQREALCTELEQLADAEDRSAAARRAKELQAQWASLPPLPGGSLARALEERFRAARDGFKVSQAPFLEQQEWQRWANRTQMETLVSEVEALDAETDLGRLADRIQQAQRRWKEIGPAPRADSAALWKSFKAACDRNFERCKPHFDELARQRAEAQERKESLCRQAEELAESSAWRESGAAIKALQAEWKSAGALPRRKDQALYTRFRTACDRFFERRQEHFATLDASRGGNQQEKEKLCARAEALVAAPQREHLKEIKDLQVAWKQIGPAPRAAEGELWQRFRSSCDRFFAWLDEARQDNLRLQEALCEEAEALVAQAAEDTPPQELANGFARLEERWNEIGPVPEGQGEALLERFRAPREAFLAARREHFARVDAERQANEERKLELLRQTEEAASEDSAGPREEIIQRTQQQWQTLGPATREREAELNKQFAMACEASLAGRFTPLAEQQPERQENLKKKESLCVELERVVGTGATTRAAGKNTALSLAEQLQLARAANFALAGEPLTPERREQEAERIREQWRSIGPVPWEHDQAIWERYRGLLAAIEGQR